MLKCNFNTSVAGFDVFMNEANKARDLVPSPLSPEFVRLMGTFDAVEFPDSAEEGLRTSNAYVRSQCPPEVADPLVINQVGEPAVMGVAYSALTVGELFLLAIERGYALTVSLEPPPR